ncbi:hypothetical protein [Clostridium beijerinckii]|uniref:Integrase n=1 Tax=Clostridium beijerinckii TaxID=1520 RepID=A0AAX0B9F3_CLOBE|nr:hypothetical protein [Clostridium beijerinckii]NRT91484.1 integrase [Clostridium beijerinckii]NYC71009.1 integrase [Clostridium beijerinckii]
MYEFLGMGLTYEELNEYQKNKADWLQKIDRYAESTKKAYWGNLNLKVNFIELQKNKDLYDFNKEEIIQLVKYLPTKSITSKQQLYTVIFRYMDWAYKEGIKIGDNPCDTIIPTELFTINEMAFKEQYIEINDFINFIYDLNCSDVDRAMLTLLRYGVKIDDVGKVKWDDIDKENKILNVLHGDKNLELPIDGIFMIMMDKAKECHRYAPGQKTVEYVDYGYIVKATATVTWKSMMPEKVYNKVGAISRINEIQRISVPDLINSRIYDLLFNTLNDYGKVTKSDIERVIETFGDEVTVIKLMRLRQNFEVLSNTTVEWKRKNRTKKIYY